MCKHYCFGLNALVSGLQAQSNDEGHFDYFTVSLQVSLVTPSRQEDVETVSSYEGAEVWRVKLGDGEDILAIKQLIDDQDVSIWNLSPTRVDFLVQEEFKVKVNRILSARSLNHTVVIMDVQRRVDTLKMKPVLWDDDTLRTGHRLNWREYPTMRVINEYFAYLAENFPSICTVKTIGHTAENRTITIIQISNGTPDNKVLLITSGSHAREWITISSALYIIEMIVTRFDQLPKYMRAVEWLIIPLLNPDGYAFSHSHDRLWRKNRRKLKSCRGVDINRNFNIDWYIHGITSPDECHESYSGAHPFSEMESVALRDMVLGSKKKPDALIDLHSCGQVIMYPWSANSNSTPHKELLWTTAKAMSDAIYNTTRQDYKIGATHYMIYPATGAALDWMYTIGTTQSFGIETRDLGDFRFLLPPEQIEPTGKEMLAATIQLAKELDPSMVQRRGTYNSWF